MDRLIKRRTNLNDDVKNEQKQGQAWSGRAGCDIKKEIT
jgi:hypothetical protein